MAASAGQALLRAIVEDPIDITPRLIYADWLEEQDQSKRAEFIRVQCAIARICKGHRHRRPEKDDESLTRLITQESSLMTGVWKEGWLDPVPKEWLADSGIRCGFVERAVCTTADWLAHGPAVVACQPVTRVTLSDRKPWDVVEDEVILWLLFENSDLPSALPPELFFALRGGLEQGDTEHFPLVRRYLVDGPNAVYFIEDIQQARAAALDDLAHAALAWARDRAGLRPLPAPAVFVGR